MKKYNILVKRAEKTVEVITEGTFTVEDANNFINDYTKTISSIKPSEFTLLLDGTSLNVSKPETLPQLEQCFMLYSQAGFSAIKFKLLNSNVVVKMQINRIAKKANLANFENILV